MNNLNEIGRRTLARSLRQRFAKSILPAVLERITDEQLLKQYELELVRKEAAIRRRAISSEMRLALADQE